MKEVIMPKVKLDWEILKHLDNTGKQLNIFTYNVPILIRSLSVKSLEMFNDLKELINSLLDFLDQKELGNTKIAKKTLKIYLKYFNNVASLDKK